MEIIETNNDISMRKYKVDFRIVEFIGIGNCK